MHAGCRISVLTDEHKKWIIRNLWQRPRPNNYATNYSTKSLTIISLPTKVHVRAIIGFENRLKDL